MLSLLIEMFGRSALAVLIGALAGGALLWRLKGKKKLFSLAPLAAGLFLAPLLFPTGLMGALTGLRAQADENAQPFPLRALTPADGWKVEVIATGYPGLRFMQMSKSGHLLISRPSAGQVLLLKAKGAGFEPPEVLLKGLDAPQGLALLRGWLYVGERGRIIRQRFDDVRARMAGKPEVLITGLPASGGHTRKSIGIGPDHALYVTVGSTCNVCIEKDARSATIMRFALDAQGRPVDPKGEIYATGLRYSVGFDWDLKGRMFATDNGRDLLGDDYPPCELNQIERGVFYGWPFYNGFGDADPDFGDHPARPKSARQPVHGFRAHNAPLGMAVLKRTRVEGYQGAMIAALHGSWNRSTYDGYKVVAVRFDKNGKSEESDFLSGFLQGQRRLGRPVAVFEARDGSVYITEDFRGTLFRMSPRHMHQQPWLDKRTQILSPQAKQNLANRARTWRDRSGGEKGAELFEQHCQNCHQQSGLEESLRNVAFRHNVNTLNSLLDNPPANMPRVELSTKERGQLIGYLLTR